MYKNFELLIILSMLTVSVKALALNNRPLIAVLSQETPVFPGYSYIVASYVKFLESAGARVVPVLTTYKPEEVKYIFKHVNGVLLPGGKSDLLTSVYFKNSLLAMEASVNATRRGEYFPIWGICLGYQALHVVVANNSDILTYLQSYGMNAKLNYTKETNNSRLFGNAPSYLYNLMQSQPIAFNHHHFSVTVKDFLSNKKLRQFFRLLTTNVDGGTNFVSTAEAFDFPMYAVAWHPEKNNYEFSRELEINHSKEGVAVSNYMANFFIDEARKSRNRFPTPELEDKYLIYRYKTTRTGGGNTDFKLYEQVYLFKI